MIDSKNMATAGLLPEDETPPMDTSETIRSRILGQRKDLTIAPSDSRGTKIRVDNLHYELTQEELEVGFYDIMHPGYTDSHGRRVSLSALDL